MTTSQTFLVPAISCDHCVNAITGEVRPLVGVESVQVDVDSKIVTVVGGDRTAIVAAIDEAGFDVASSGGRAPARAELQNDDGVVRVTKWTFEPGTETGQHVHEFDFVVVPITGGELTIEMHDGESAITPLTIGESYQRGKGVAHNVANDGPATVSFVEIELLLQ